MMNKAFRIIHPVCILPVLSFFLGCGGDNPASVKKTTPFLGGSIGVYADIDGTRPYVFDTGGAVTFYVVHVTEDATASAFKIEAPTGWTRLGAEAQFPVAIGNIDDGISIGYGKCVPGAIHVMTLTYESPGNSQPGTMFKVLPHAQWPEYIQVINCDEGQPENASGEETPVMLWETGGQTGGQDKNKEMNTH